jgi:hypothetical protein
MQKAPSKRKDGGSRLGFKNDLPGSVASPLRAGRWTRYVAAPRIRAPPWLLPRSPERAAAAQASTVPRPGAIRKGGRAYSFAGRGISVACLAIYKARQSGVYLLQTKRRFEDI